MQISAFDAQRHEPHAVIRAEDTYRVLAADPTPRPVETSLDTLTHQAMATPAHEPGSIVVCPGRPIELLVIVHDLDREPTWHPEWIRRALTEALTTANTRGLVHVATELLGTVHGRADTDEALGLLADGLDAAGERIPQRLWLMGAGRLAVARLKRLLGERGLE
jgi:hypothetical protein